MTTHYLIYKKLHIMPQQASKPTNMSPRSMESAYEFARTGKATRLICTAFHKFLQSVKDPRQTSRLTSKLSEIIKTDTIHGRGERTVGAGDVSLLEGFDFCITQQLQRLLMMPLTATIDRATGICTVPLPTFTPNRDMHITGNVTHIQICAAATELNFERERFVTDLRQSEALPLDEPIHLVLHPSIPQDSRKTILVAVGIKLLQVVNGRVYEMSGGRSAFHIVKAEGEVWNGEPEVRSKKPEVGSQKPEKPKASVRKRATNKGTTTATSRTKGGKRSTPMALPGIKLTGRGSQRRTTSS